MERIAWTDERLDDLSRRVDAGFTRIDADLRELRFTILRVGGGIMIALIGVIGAVLVSA
ncbi:MAG: hypothetical protein ACR2OC_12300 [Solirubrobacterales bacterium]